MTGYELGKFMGSTLALWVVAWVIWLLVKRVMAGVGGVVLSIMLAWVLVTFGAVSLAMDRGTPPEDAMIKYMLPALLVLALWLPIRRLRRNRAANRNATGIGTERR